MDLTPKQHGLQITLLSLLFTLIHNYVRNKIVWIKIGTRSLGVTKSRLTEHLLNILKFRIKIFITELKAYFDWIWGKYMISHCCRGTLRAIWTIQVLIFRLRDFPLSALFQKARELFFFLNTPNRVSLLFTLHKIARQLISLLSQILYSRYAVWPPLPKN